MKKKELKAAVRQTEQIAEEIAYRLVQANKELTFAKREITKLKNTLHVQAQTVTSLANENKALQQALADKGKYIECLEGKEPAPTVLRNDFCY